MIVQEYVPGREITVLVLGGKAMGVLEILVNGEEVYDTTQKKDKVMKGLEETAFVVPALLPAEDYEHALRMAETAHKTLGCSGMTELIESKGEKVLNHPVCSIFVTF